MKKIVIFGAVVLTFFFALDLSRFAGNVFNFSHIYFQEDRRYPEVNKNIRQKAEKIASCAGLPKPKIFFWDGDTFKKMYPGENNAYALTRERSLMELSMNKLCVSFDVDKMIANSDQIDLTVSHELAHHILEPTVYHKFFHILAYGDMYNNEKLADIIGEYLLKVCNQKIKGP